MPETDIGSADYGDKENQQDDFSVDSQTLDSAQDTKETTYFNNNFSQQLGYYKEIPELKTAIDAKARWIIGEGITSNELTEMRLFTLRGFGKDTINDILENQMRVTEIAGDSFAHIIRAGWMKRALSKLPFVGVDGLLINLKPLGQLQIVTNRAGLIIRYEQLDRQNKKVVKTFKPGEIFHLCRDRVGDEIHGVSVIDALEENILMRNEAMADYKKLLHRNVFPVRVWHLDTDDTTEIASFKEKADKAGYEGENFYVPKGAVEMEVTGVAPNATLNPLPWIKELTGKFYQEIGVPQVIVGGSAEFTEATAKIVFVAFETTIKAKQRYLMDQFLSQLNLEIELEIPASLQNELISAQKKAETMQASTPEDTSVTNVGVGG